MKLPNNVNSLDDFVGYLERLGKHAAENGSRYETVAVGWTPDDLETIVPFLKEKIAEMKFDAYWDGVTQTENDMAENEGPDIFN